MRLSDYMVVPADVSHLGALPGIERAASARFGTSVPAHILDATTSVTDLQRAQRDGRLWVALAADGEPVGFALAEAVDGFAHLDELDVVPEHGRKGIGAALVATVERWAIARGLRAMTLTTCVDVPWNAEWYAKLGFEPIAERDLDDRLRRRLEEEERLGLERARRVAMRKPLAACSQA